MIQAFVHLFIQQTQIESNSVPDSVSALGLLVFLALTGVYGMFMFRVIPDSVDILRGCLCYAVSFPT